MKNLGLLLLAIIQIYTAGSAFLNKNYAGIKGIEMFHANQSIFRYLLVALWLSVGIVYLVGSFNQKFLAGACLLAVLNVSFEIISYWSASNMPLWGQIAGTLVMGIPGLLSLRGLLQK